MRIHDSKSQYSRSHYVGSPLFSRAFHQFGLVLFKCHSESSGYDLNTAVGSAAACADTSDVLVLQSTLQYTVVLVQYR